MRADGVDPRRWPVGVTHAFVWGEGKIWLTFAAHRHRPSAETAKDPGAAKPKR